jgi:hypothetical protein
MRKQIIDPTQKEAAASAQAWLNVEDLAEVQITSEDAAHPIESALLPGDARGWRAAGPGRQTIRLVFDAPQQLRRIRLRFVETGAARTQEYILRWSADGGQSFRDIVRQQWHFNPEGADSEEIEDHHIELAAVTVLELGITPDISGGEAVASLEQLQLA